MERGCVTTARSLDTSRHIVGSFKVVLFSVVAVIVVVVAMVAAEEAVIEVVMLDRHISLRRLEDRTTGLSTEEYQTLRRLMEKHETFSSTTSSTMETPSQPER